MNFTLTLLSLLVLTDIALLFIGVLKKNRAALIASGVVFAVLVFCFLYLTPLSRTVS